MYKKYMELVLTVFLVTLSFISAILFISTLSNIVHFIFLQMGSLIFMSENTLRVFSMFCSSVFCLSIICWLIFIRKKKIIINISDEENKDEGKKRRK